MLSPSNRFADVLRKVYEYLDAGARLVWELDPEGRSAAVFRHGEIRPTTIAGDGVLDGEDVLPGLTLPLRDSWEGLEEPHEQTS